MLAETLLKKLASVGCRENTPSDHPPRAASHWPPVRQPDGGGGPGAGVGVRLPVPVAGEGGGERAVALRGGRHVPRGSRAAHPAHLRGFRAVAQTLPGRLCRRRHLQVSLCIGAAC